MSFMTENLANIIINIGTREEILTSSYIPLRNVKVVHKPSHSFKLRLNASKKTIVSLLIIM